MNEILRFNYLGLDLMGKTSGQIATTCIYCSQDRKKKKDKCCSINLDTGLFNCHHCGKTGNIHIYKTNVIKKEVYDLPPAPVISLSQHVIEWFQDRGISHKTLKRLKITSKSEFMPQLEKNAPVICFNYYRSGELVNVKYRSKEKHFKLFKNGELIFYNLDSIKDSRTVIITEGEIDCLSFIEVGYDCVVSVPNGASKGKSELKYLDNCIDYFVDKTHIYIAVDNDPAGLELRNNLITRLGIERCYRVDFEDCKDANEYLTKHGSQKLFQSISDFKRFPIEGIVRVEDIKEEITNIWKNGLDTGMTIGVSAHDEMIRFQTGRLCVLTGIPGHGKSEYLDWLISRFIIKQQFKAAYFSPENFPLELHFSKLSEKIIGRQLPDFSENEIEKITTYLNEYAFFIKPRDEGYTLEQILENAKKLIFLHGIKILVIDPWNRLEHQMQNSQSETNYVSQQLSKLLTFAQNNDILVFLIAHPTKMKKDKTTGEFEVPTLYDINGSANFFNKCDYGITIYRDFKNKEIQVHIQKVKFRHLGNIGKDIFKFNINNGRFTEKNAELIEWDNSDYLVEKPVPF